MAHRRLIATFVLGSALIVSGCDSSSPAGDVGMDADVGLKESAADASSADASDASPVSALPADQFLAAIAQHCWRSFAGQIVANEPAEENDPFVGKPMVMHVRECSEDAIRIPFHVGDDHSRTWVLTRTNDGVQLKHDHRHEDGSNDELTMYGGDSAGEGSASRHEFPADAESKAMFESGGIPVSSLNIWAVEVEPGKRFIYELSRPGRLFRVEFDLSKPVETPPDPWGAEQPK